MASDAPPEIIRIPRLIWSQVILELRRRGEGRRESGAFLLGQQRGTKGKVTKFVCYDDLDPEAYQGGGIQFHGSGFAALWTRCREQGCQVLCDVHTHPRGIKQSRVDKSHPMIAIAGHTAMIVPNYANTTRWSLKPVGVYEYLGGIDWRTHEPDAKTRRVRLSWW